MSDYIYLADARVLLWLNHWLAAHPDLYKIGLLLTDEVADILTLATLLWLWFWSGAGRPSLLTAVRLPSRESSPRESETDTSQSAIGPKILTRVRGRIAADPKSYKAVTVAVSSQVRRHLTRHASRAQLLVFGMAGMAAYVTARVIAMIVNIDRPFVTYLPVKSGVEGAFEELRTFGSFPSDHAALLGALPIALLYWDRRLARIWMALSVFLMVVRVAVGFHYPADMIVGAAIGMACAAIAMNLYDREGRLYSAANALARGFDLSNAPYCYYLYFFMLLLGVEAAMHFQHVLGLLHTLGSEISQRLSF